MKFQKFDDKAKSRLEIYLKGKNLIGSGFSYYSFLIWFPTLEYAEEDDVFYMRATLHDDEVYYWKPLVKEGDDRDFTTLYKNLPDDACFAFLTKEDATMLPETDYAISTDRDWSEYIYKSEDFIGLKGKRYHAKRNHISKFSSRYEVEMKKFSADDKPALTAFEKRWYDLHPFEGGYDKSAKEEMRIVEDWYAAALKGELVCDVLYADGNLVGVSIGEIMPSRNAVVMYEKADIEYDGVYSYLAHAFAERNFRNCTYINRQEDMGLEGLRKSKLSYYPEFMLDKYIAKRAFRANLDGSLPKSMTAPHADKFPDVYYTRKMTLDDFDLAYSFYKRGIAGLKDKKFFMNYKPEELKVVLSDGYMLGVFDGDRLISLCAVDLDKTYGNMLAEICGDVGGAQYYELSGIMTDEEYRGRGVSHFLTLQILDYAHTYLSPCVLCAVVQFDNVPSLENLKKFGFVESGRKAYEEYDFKYLTLRFC